MWDSNIKVAIMSLFNFSNMQFGSSARVKYFSSDTLSFTRISMLAMHNKLI